LILILPVAKDAYAEQPKATMPSCWQKFPRHVSPSSSKLTVPDVPGCDKNGLEMW